MTKNEFISKYHTQKVLKFEPPTWEEFLATRDVAKGILAHWYCGNISIVMCEENNKRDILHCSTNTFEISDIITWVHVDYYNDYVSDNREECYYKALDIAKEWFLGEEE